VHHRLGHEGRPRQVEMKRPTDGRLSHAQPPSRRWRSGPVLAAAGAGRPDRHRPTHPTPRADGPLGRRLPATSPKPHTPSPQRALGLGARGRDAMARPARRVPRPAPALPPAARPLVRRRSLRPQDRSQELPHPPQQLPPDQRLPAHLRRLRVPPTLAYAPPAAAAFRSRVDFPAPQGPVNSTAPRSRVVRPGPRGTAVRRRPVREAAVPVTERTLAGAARQTSPVAVGERDAEIADRRGTSTWWAAGLMTVPG
jgi:hypothetical protein